MTFLSVKKRAFSKARVKHNMYCSVPVKTLFIEVSRPD